MMKDNVVSKPLLADVEALADDLNGDMEDGMDFYNLFCLPPKPNPVFADAAELRWRAIIPHRRRIAHWDTIIDRIAEPSRLMSYRCLPVR